jgi:hypothetical protein
MILIGPRVCMLDVPRGVVGTLAQGRIVGGTLGGIFVFSVRGWLPVLRSGVRSSAFMAGGTPKKN